MWSKTKIQHVDGMISRVALSFLTGDKDELADALFAVEKDTGYDIDFIYDIFVEQYEDELDDAEDIETAAGRAAHTTITVAYEQDY